ncbi:MAG: energy transducer TonB [Gemmatimonadaceae bacterium]
MKHARCTGSVLVAFAAGCVSSPAAESPAAFREGCPAPVTRFSRSDTIWLIDQVDRPAEPLRSNPAPDYPPSIAGSVGADYESTIRETRNGQVEVGFIVNALGRADSASMRVIRESSPVFTEEVRAVLPKLRYEPAYRGGCPVPMWLNWKFLFMPRAGVRVPGTGARPPD